MSDPTAFPLQWPAGWPRTDAKLRERAKFKQTLHSALTGLKREVQLLGGKTLVLSSNYTLGLENPKDCGVVAYFTYNASSVAIPCDRWLRIEHNVQAIALTIEAMRGMERWGAKHMIEAMFTGFKQIEARTGGLSWWDILGVAPTATAEQIKTAYREKARVAHPDAGAGHRSG
ncbi:MAG TPA: DnaJ domain-containing protein [Methylomirabilota bacterium]|nr:DnaJ domain-containing protein [Methylomirabilota bacterium]